MVLNIPGGAGFGTFTVPWYCPPPGVGKFTLTPGISSSCGTVVTLNWPYLSMFGAAAARFRGDTPGAVCTEKPYPLILILVPLWSEAADAAPARTTN